MFSHMNPKGVGGFKKGQSGNPGGRPKMPPEIRALAREHSRLAIERLVHWAKSDDPMASAFASSVLLERAGGKVRCAMEESANSPLPARINPDSFGSQ